MKLNHESTRLNDTGSLFEDIFGQPQNLEKESLKRQSMILVGIHKLNIVQAGLPDVIPTEACYLGWQESLSLLAKLVEAEISDNG